MSYHRICPLFFASPVSDIEMDCRPDRCAWAHDGECAMTAIAKSLEGLNDTASAWLEKEDNDNG